MKHTKFSAFFLLLALPLGAWSESGHQVVAQIALNQFSQAEQKKIQSVMGDLLELSAEPDNYREISTSMAGWHYIDYPLVEEPVINILKLIPKKNNIVSALKEAKRVIQKSQKQTRNPELAHIFKANFVHFMGDLHQPLHCVARVTEKNPKGDKGGNLFSVKFEKKKINLHTLWDIGLGSLDHLTRDQVMALAKSIEKEVPKPEITGNFEDWSKESYYLAKSDVYQTREDQEVSAEYIEKGRKIVKKRLALAGYRLAKELRELIL
ncbi:MAG: S1/P1 nuclease [Myxococcaceae bacterium]